MKQHVMGTQLRLRLLVMGLLLQDFESWNTSRTLPAIAHIGSSKQTAKAQARLRRSASLRPCSIVNANDANTMQLPMYMATDIVPTLDVMRQRLSLAETGWADPTDTSLAAVQVVGYTYPRREGGGGRMIAHLRRGLRLLCVTARRQARLRGALFFAVSEHDACHDVYSNPKTKPIVHLGTG